jgi:hypothetical protein
MARMRRFVVPHLYTMSLNAVIVYRNRFSVRMTIAII